MPDADFTSTRLFVEAPLAGGAVVPLTADQLNYLRNVLRFADGDGLLVFDGRSGEWRARYRATGKKTAELEIVSRTRPQPPPADLWYLFAPLKHARLDYMVQKAVEMGATRLAPVLTRRSQASRVNLDRMHANAVEAAEQCGVLQLPEVVPEEKLAAVLDGWDPARRLIFCDEAAPVADPLAALAVVPHGPLAVLIGPEGGFDETERKQLLALPNVTAIALGPRILRADTAAVAALAVIQAVLGDWR
jgi:16S rRNA (uracil1498-N3)-methyltransferase